MSARQAVLSEFRERFGAEPTFLVRAPGRVNLIGEHTDYNDGFVMPMAIDREIWIALRPTGDRRVRAHSLDYHDSVSFGLDPVEHGDQPWAEYLRGVAWVMEDAGMRLDGWEGVMAGDVPRGAGLSSSAAVELVAERAFAAVGGLAWDPARMALLGQRVENDWVGVESGIMDQMVVAAGKEGHALLIDCRSLDARPTPLPAGAAVVILDTDTRRGLVDSAYNERHAQCVAAAKALGVPALRDVDAAALEAGRAALDPLTYRRARHVVTENERTLRAADAMRAGDLEELGRLMDASHLSLRDDFEVTSDALNAIVEVARAQPGCFGARMTGAGFGGCAVALIDAGQAEPFIAAVTDGYHARTGLDASCYLCRATDGASVEEMGA